LHGKEGVDGSSPSEGFEKASKWPFLLPRRDTTDSRPTRKPSPKLVPTCEPERFLGLNRGIREHRAPPCEGGARRWVITAVRVVQRCPAVAQVSPGGDGRGLVFARVCARVHIIDKRVRTQRKTADG